MKRTRLIPTLAVGVAMAMSLAACGSDDDESSSGKTEISWWHNSNNDPGKAYYEPSDQGLEIQIGERLQRLRRARLERRRETGSSKKTSWRSTGATAMSVNSGATSANSSWGASNPAPRRSTTSNRSPEPCSTGIATALPAPVLRWTRPWSRSRGPCTSRSVRCSPPSFSTTGPTSARPIDSPSSSDGHVSRASASTSRSVPLGRPRHRVRPDAPRF